MQIKNNSFQRIYNKTFHIKNTLNTHNTSDNSYLLKQSSGKHQYMLQACCQFDA